MNEYDFNDLALYESKEDIVRRYLFQKEIVPTQLLYELITALYESDQWPKYNSAHEGLGVLWEEFEELKEHVFTNQKRRNINEMRLEALQVAAVALRFARDVCNEEVGRK